MNEFDRFRTPFEERYSSKEMLYLFSPNKKFTTWRKLWIALAESEKELGLNITQEQINEMKSHIEDIDFEYAKEMEARLHREVKVVPMYSTIMAHTGPDTIAFGYAKKLKG